MQGFCYPLKANGLTSFAVVKPFRVRGNDEAEFWMGFASLRHDLAASKHFRKRARRFSLRLPSFPQKRESKGFAVP
jgi:hypothetical protein